MLKNVKIKTFCKEVHLKKAHILAEINFFEAGNGLVPQKIF